MARRSKSAYRRRNWITIILISAALVGLVAFGVKYYMQTVSSSSRTTVSPSSRTTVSSSSRTTVSSSSRTTVSSSSRTTVSPSSRTTVSPSSRTTVSPSSQTMTYVTHSPPTSQWLILSFSQPPEKVTANNTGPLPQFPSSESLNATKIGVYCEQTVTSESASGLGGNSTAGACAQFMTYQQTGWYWDQKSELLFIHYLGGPNVQISIVVGGSASSST